MCSLAESQPQAPDEQFATNHGRGRGRWRSPGRPGKGTDVLGKSRSTTTRRLLTRPWPDLYRRALPAAHTARLPAHLLRRLSEGVVRLPSLDRHVDTPVHLPLVPGLGAHHTAQCHRHHAARHLPQGEPPERQKRPREAGGPRQIPARRQCATQAQAPG